MILNLGKVLHLSFNLLLVGLSFSACANISQKYLKDLGYNSLGNISLGITYSMRALGSPLASYFSEKYQSRYVVNFGAFTYFLYILAMVIPTLKVALPESDSFAFTDRFIIGMILVASFIRGLGGAMYWVGGLMYLKECSTDETKSVLYGTQFSISYSNMMFGSLISAFLLGRTNRLTFFIVMGTINLAACVSFLFLRKTAK